MASRWKVVSLAKSQLFVSVFDPSDPLRFKLKLALFPPEPIKPEACALICAKSTGPAKNLEMMI